MPHRPAAPIVAALALALSLLALVGCHGGPILPESHDPPRLRPSVDRLNATEAVARYNAHAVMLDKLWSRTDLKLRWEEDDGDRRRQTAEGKLIYQRDAAGPDRDGVAITAGKLGQTGLWAGSDGRRYWLFDLRDSGHAWVGTVGRAASMRPGQPLIVPPDAVPALLGLKLIAPGSRATPTPRGYLSVWADDRTRLLLDPRTGLPIRAHLLDAYGQDAVIAHLDRHRPADVAGLTDANRPMVATEIDLYLPRQTAHLALKVSGITDERINPAVFDLDTLMQTHKPAMIESLDRP